MSKLGMIGKANDSGLGAIAAEFRDHLPVECQLLIDDPGRGTFADRLKCPYVSASVRPTLADLDRFLESGVTHVLVIETPFNWDFLRLMHERDVKVFFIPMVDQRGPDMLSAYLPYVTEWICPTSYSFRLLQEVGFKGMWKPIPVDTDRFEFKQRFDGQVTFLHNAGFEGICSPRGIGTRKGTDIVLEAFKLVKDLGVKLIVNAQVNYAGLEHLLEGVDFRVHNIPDRYSVYDEGDIYLAPSRKEGVGLPIYEAMSCGLPVVTSDFEPMNEAVVWEDCRIRTVKEVDPGDSARRYCEASVEDLARLMATVTFAVAEERHRWGSRSSEVREFIRKNFSWGTWRDSWLELLK